jgi:hypothetical protein
MTSYNGTTVMSSVPQRYDLFTEALSSLGTGRGEGDAVMGRGEGVGSTGLKPS